VKSSERNDEQQRMEQFNGNGVKSNHLEKDDTNTSSSIGVQSTPTFLINGKPLIGAQPFEVFKPTIDSFLK
jgi:protein-disulfide isomerase